MLKPKDLECYFSEMNRLIFIKSWGSWSGEEKSSSFG